MSTVTTPTFSTDEILWYDNGKWGQAGYAVANPAGQTWTNNAVIFNFHTLVGRNMFELMHRSDVKFYTAPHKQFWFDLHQLIVTARKRLADRQRLPNDSNGLVVQHAAPAPQMFLAWPIPFFGERVRQPDIREYAQLALLMLSEMMQHSENELATYITDAFASKIGQYLREILALMATKYFGYTRTQAYDPAFALSATDFANYDPSKVMTSVEMTEERPPLLWWPTENDLSDIRGLPFDEVLVLCKQWPTGATLSTATNVPGGTATTGGTTAGGSSAGAAASPTASFTTPPGQAP
ncbi:MAG TPA: hypothetical protein VHV08_05180 [Pirellulales bacterium]|jgi:hypothetical protein|nr:hypothetical protein [Pirellulales bacterium]